jgi:hypothetical protein
MARSAEGRRCRDALGRFVQFSAVTVERVVHDEVLLLMEALSE